MLPVNVPPMILTHDWGHNINLQTLPNTRLPVNLLPDGRIRPSCCRFRHRLAAQPFLLFATILLVQGGGDFGRHEYQAAFSAAVCSQTAKRANQTAATCAAALSPLTTAQSLPKTCR